ncbi:hypothetical protein FQA39_LY11114 [Lamprigera yunnana]|nr:hypothetical protein FQA39_LY11114 [Lamprigera yunnana]
MQGEYNLNRPLTEEELIDIIDNLSDLSGEDNDAEDDIWQNIVEVGEPVAETNDLTLVAGESVETVEESTEIIEQVEETPVTNKAVFEAFLTNNHLTKKENIECRNNVTYVTPPIN